MAVHSVSHAQAPVHQKHVTPPKPPVNNNDDKPVQTNTHKDTEKTGKKVDIEA